MAGGEILRQKFFGLTQGGIVFIKIKLLGKLGQLFGRMHLFQVSSPREAIKALCVNFPEFERHIVDSEQRNVGYRVITQGQDRTESELDYPLGSDTLVIVPAVFGSGGPFWNIIAGVALVGAGLLFGFAPLALLGASLILRGISELLSPQPDSDDEEKRSFYFGSSQNTAGQGGCLALSYGRILTVSQTISASMSAEDTFTVAE